jgi:hypothetical protein
MSKTGYIEIASRLVTVARSCFCFYWLGKSKNFLFFYVRQKDEISLIPCRTYELLTKIFRPVVVEEIVQINPKMVFYAFVGHLGTPTWT